MSAVSATLAGRRAAEALMLDAGTAKRPTGTAYTSGTEVTTYTTLIFVGLQDPGFRPPGAGGRGRGPHFCRRPPAVASACVHRGTGGRGRVHVTTPHAVSTVPSGAVYRITAPVEGLLPTARRYTVERVVS